MKWCDLECEYARWPDSKDLSGACRTFQALYCRKLKRAVPKNGPCQCTQDDPTGRKSRK